MKVYVIMGNDYPDAVYSSKEAAEAHCAERRKESNRIRWTFYEYELDA